MKVLLLAFGTRGDVQPFVAMARELRARGHEPVLAGPRRFTGLAAEHGLALAAVDESPLRFLDAAADGVGDATGVGVRGKVALARAMPASFDRVFDDTTAVGEQAVVHHGGAGTTGAAAAAGRPQVICPFVADQPFWGRRMRDLGVAPPPIPQRKLAADRLAAALDHVLTDTGVRSAAVELGRRIRSEDGTAAAVAQLELIVRDGAHR